jgi:PiT family inorganic phosphate transporter
MSAVLWVIIGIIATALIFDFFNGFHDAANSVATVVTTRVLTPIQAVLWAALFNFIAAFVFGTGVAKTISEKLIDPHAVDIYVVLGGVLGAIAWDIITWLLALPTSSSHALISGFAGAAIAKAGFSVILVQGWIPVIVFLILSPLIGLILGWTIMTAVSWLSFRTERHKAEGIFRHLQLISAGAYSLGHGTNDAQKTMGIIVALLVAGGKKDWTTGGYSLLGHKHEIALWIILSCHAAMALGTFFGGWRIVKTMGSRITPHLRPVGGFSAECAAATTIALATFANVPISTTHAIGGSIAGVGATRGAHAVRWQWGKRIMWAWVLTFPGAALIGALSYAIVSLTLGHYFPAPVAPA